VAKAETKMLPHEKEWRDIGDFLGLRLAGWTDDSSATFVDDTLDRIKMCGALRRALLLKMHPPTEFDEPWEDYAGHPRTGSFEVWSISRKTGLEKILSGWHHNDPRSRYFVPIKWRPQA
jgi:hypothetical protein